MKGIILAGGTGSRLFPITQGVVKQLLPIYDKPMIYYPLSVLMLANIREVLIISTPQELSRFGDLFSDGSQLGMDIQYIAQPSPDGIAQAFILGESFIGNDDIALVLGDNIFYGHALPELLQESIQTVEQERKGVVFGYYVTDPERYGVVEFDDHKNAIGIEEKPEKPKSDYAVSGLYFYPPDVVKIAKSLQPSTRGELEITDLNLQLLQQQRLKVKLMGRGYAWLDTGTHESLLEAGNFIEIIEKRQGLKVACLEEIAYRKKWIDTAQLKQFAERYKKNQYGQYLSQLLTREFR